MLLDVTTDIKKKKETQPGQQDGSVVQEPKCTRVLLLHLYNIVHSVQSGDQGDSHSGQRVAAHIRTIH